MKNFEIDKIKSAVGKKFLMGGCDTGKAKILRVGKHYTTFVSIKNSLNDSTKVGIVFKENNIKALEIIH